MLISLAQDVNYTVQILLCYNLAIGLGHCWSLENNHLKERKRSSSLDGCSALRSRVKNIKSTPIEVSSAQTPTPPQPLHNQYQFIHLGEERHCESMDKIQ